MTSLPLGSLSRWAIPPCVQQIINQRVADVLRAGIVAGSRCDNGNPRVSRSSRAPWDFGLFAGLMPAGAAGFAAAAGAAVDVPAGRPAVQPRRATCTIA